MPEYYMSRTPDNDGFYEIHHIVCLRLDGVDLGEFVYLGRFNSCYKALKVAKEHYGTADGCRRCASSCHTDRRELVRT